MDDVEIRVKSRDDSGPGFNSAENRFKKLKQVGKAAAAGMGVAGAAAGGLFAKGVADNMGIEVANDKLAAQLGLTEQQSKQAGEMAGKIYAANWGASITDVNNAIKSVGDNIGNVSNMAPKDLEKITVGAMAIAQTFDIDVNESTKAAGQLMKNGLAKDSTEAFDLITAGMQNGLNRSGDFLETLGEYSPQFAKLGIKGPQAIGLLSSFLKAGARDTDVAADAFKEFSIRAIDGSKLTMDAYKDLGLNGKKMGKQIAEGGQGAIDGLDQIIRKLQETKDPVEQNRLGTALFGTQWEDTVRQILPKIDITESAIEGVDGATQKMADTLGDNASGKIETMKRGFEQWTQKMAASESQVGLIATGVVQFGGGALAASSQIAMMAVAMRGLNVAMLMNPIGLVVVALALLAAGLVVLYMKSEKARNIMNLVFAGISTYILDMVTVGLQAFKLLLGSFMSMASGILTASEKAFGWMPGIGDKVKKAKHAFDGFKDGVNAALDSSIKKTKEWRDRVNRMPKEVRLKGNISDLKAKIESAKARLKTVPKSKQAAIRANIAQLKRQVEAAKRALAQVKNKYITVNTHYTTTGRRTAPSEMMAHGGISGAASGGVHGNLVEVGEYGREIVKLPYGSQVIPKGRSDAMMGGGGGGGGPLVLELRSGGSRLDDLLVELVRGAIRRRGGNVQVVLGKA